MTLQSALSGINPLTINEIKAEFGYIGSNSGPTTLTSYRRGGGYVPNHDVNVNIPATGTVRVSNFVNADKTFRKSVTGGSLTTFPIGAIVTYSGYSTNLDGIGSFGSALSGATYCGISSSSLAQATLGGFYGTTATPTGIAGPGRESYSTTLILVGGDFTASATWTSLTITQSTSATLYRTNSFANYSGSSAGNYTKYTWGTVNEGIGSGTIVLEIT